MRLTGDGNVGIGLTDPGEKLSVAGNVMIGDADWADGTTTGDLAIQGNVGIGTTNPGHKLQIVHSSPTQGLSILNGANSNSETFNLGTTANHAFLRIYDSAGNEDIRLRSGSGDSWISTGRVGIGNTAPGARLSVQGGVSIGDATYAQTAAPTGGMIIKGNVGIGTTTPESRLVVKGSGATSGTSALNVTNSTDTSLLFVRNNGNVGIGTTTPGADLVVAGTTGKNLFQIATSTNQHIFIVDENGKVGVGVAEPSAKFDILGRSLTERVLDVRTLPNFSSGASVGRIWLNTQAYAGTIFEIGKSSGSNNYTPIFEFRNKSAATNWITADLRMYGANAGTGAGGRSYTRFTAVTGDDADRVAMQFRVEDSGGGALATANLFEWANQNSVRMAIDATGNVGIGTTSPWRKLSVAGTVGFDGLTGSTGAGSLCLDSNNQVVYNSGSDACLSSTRDTKHDVEGLSLEGHTIVNRLEPVSFVYNQGDGRTRYGFIAEDAAEIAPSLATYNASSSITGIDDRAILSVVVKAIKELWAYVKERFASQDAEIEALKARVSDLEAQLGASGPQSHANGSNGQQAATSSPTAGTSTTSTPLATPDVQPSSPNDQVTAANDNEPTASTDDQAEIGDNQPASSTPAANDNMPVLAASSTASMSTTTAAH